MSGHDLPKPGYLTSSVSRTLASTPRHSPSPEPAANSQKLLESLVTPLLSPEHPRPAIARGRTVAVPVGGPQEQVQDIDGGVDIAIPEASAAVTVETVLHPEAVLLLVHHIMTSAAEFGSSKLVNHHDLGAPQQVLHPCRAHDGREPPHIPSQVCIAQRDDDVLLLIDLVGCTI